MSKRESIAVNAVETATVELGTTSGGFGLHELRAAIPAKCFKASYRQAVTLLVRDVVIISSLTYGAYHYIPEIENTLLRTSAWIFYGWLQGLIFTGLWVIGHECGHGSYFPSKAVNDTVGFIAHSFLMTSYFSWQSTHRRHHVWANDMKMDHNYVPLRRNEYLDSFKQQAERVDHLAQDAPFYTFIRIIMQQLFGWPWYLLFNITSSATSLPQDKKPRGWLGNSHINPWATLFRVEEAHLILLSDIGLGSMALLLYTAAAKMNGPGLVFFLWVQPYLWLNNWIVAITYLHHTHPDVPKYEHEAWTFIKGATATIDRNLGFIGKHCFHNIADYHVIHHLFPRIACYHTVEATKAIIPVLGEMYREDKKRSFMEGLWEAFTRCQWVEGDNSNDAKNRALWYKAGPSPPPAIRMPGLGS